MEIPISILSKGGSCFYLFAKFFLCFLCTSHSLPAGKLLKTASAFFRHSAAAILLQAAGVFPFKAPSNRIHLKNIETPLERCYMKW
ncbi:MAG: hypothetical protein LKE53_02045 [Oscillospiraceae bacterium]|jgi:hypothetical protein|nr:hypothetical protein [Oscillospiraceae bacterium]MDD3261004.1 hypothetical protein [Oscillospiraceae bacterium]